jgi:hypothetical protein
MKSTILLKHIRLSGTLICFISSIDPSGAQVTGKVLVDMLKGTTQYVCLIGVTANKKTKQYKSSDSTLWV